MQSPLTCKCFVYSCRQWPILLRLSRAGLELPCSSRGRGEWVWFSKGKRSLNVEIIILFIQRKMAAWQQPAQEMQHAMGGSWGEFHHTATVTPLVSHQISAEGAARQVGNDPRQVDAKPFTYQAHTAPQSYSVLPPTPVTPLVAPPPNIHSASYPPSFHHSHGYAETRTFQPLSASSSSGIVGGYSSTGLPQSSGPVPMGYYMQQTVPIKPVQNPVSTMGLQGNVQAAANVSGEWGYQQSLSGGFNSPVSSSVQFSPNQWRPLQIPAPGNSSENISHPWQPPPPPSTSLPPHIRVGPGPGVYSHVPPPGVPAEHIWQPLTNSGPLPPAAAPPPPPQIQYSRPRLPVPHDRFIADWLKEVGARKPPESNTEMVHRPKVRENIFNPSHM